MSFADLTADIANDTKEVVFTVGEKTLIFKAKQKPFLVLQASAGKALKDDKNYLAYLLTECVEDENGDYMTYEQALNLPCKYARPLVSAVMEINGLADGESEKN